MGKNNKKPSPFRRNFRPQFDRREGFKKSKRQNPNFERIDGEGDETLYRILCPVKKIGSVIGKGGDIIKAMREETHAKIKVGEPVLGADERVVIVFSSSAKVPKVDDNNENEQDPENENVDVSTEEKHDPMEPHCPAQHALLKVHERIYEDDGVFGAPVREENNEDDVVTARLLVPNNQVGCLLGKGGHVIQKLRTETGANIRILPEGHLPACAENSDELVQISGKSATAKRALYEVSTLLHQNPRPPMKDSKTDRGPGFYPSAAPVGGMSPQGIPMSQRNPGFRGPPTMPWGGDFPRFPPGDAAAEFSMKILCPVERIGGVIGKGGGVVKQIQHETGTDIRVEPTIPDAEERAIFVSSFDAPWNPISPTIEAILHLQVKTSVLSEDGTITTRLLVPSSKVGCLLGQGGHIINEMRRRSRADIRVLSKEGKPNYLPVDEELVQVSGIVNVARDALTEIASRLRMRSLEGINGAPEPGPVGPFHGFGHPESFHERRLPPPTMNRGRSSGGYGHAKGAGNESGNQSYSTQPTPGFPNFNSSMQVKIPNSAISSVLGANIGQMSGAKVKLNDPQAGGGSECVVEIHGSFEQMSAAENLLQTLISSSEQNFNTRQHHVPHSSAAHSFNTHHHAPHSSAAQNFNERPQPGSYTSTLSNSNVQQAQTTYGGSAQNSNVHQQPQSPYASVMPSSNTQPQILYSSSAPNYNAQQQQSSYASAAVNYNSQQQKSPYASATPNYNAQQQQSSYASTVSNYNAQQQQSPYASTAPNYNAQQQQSPYASSAPSYNQQQQQQQSPYASTAPNYNAQQQQQSPYASTAPNYNAQQQQSSYASTAPNYNAQQQQQSPYASTAPNYNAQQQSSYASTAPNYNPYQQQQQSTYAPAVQNYNTHQQEQNSYAPVMRNSEGQQQQSYQY